MAADRPHKTTKSVGEGRNDTEGLTDGTRCSAKTGPLADLTTAKCDPCLEIDDELLLGKPGKQLLAQMLLSCLILLIWVFILLSEALSMISTLDKAGETDIPTAKELIPITKVKDTTELLELIFQHLPPIDIVRATRVDKKFHNLIHKSPTLQRASFMLPPKDKKSTRYCEARLFPPPNIYKPFLQPLPSVNGIITPPPPIQTPRLLPDSRYSRSQALQISSLCPLLEADHDEAQWTRTPPTATLNTTSISISTPVHFSEKAKQAWQAGPWTHMQLSNPPTTRVHVKLYWECRNRMTNKITQVLIARSSLEDDDGMTLHSLVDGTSSTSDVVVISTPVYEAQDSSSRDKITSWSNSEIRNTTLWEQMGKLSAESAGREWSLGMQSRVSLVDVVVPATEGEQERLMDGSQRRVVPVFRWYLFE